MSDKKVKTNPTSSTREQPRRDTRKFKGAVQERSDRVQSKKPQADDGPIKPHRTPRPGASRGAKSPDRSRAKRTEAKEPRDDDAGMRIAKVMARAGLCSRRDAEAWIEQGRVFLNGKVLTSPAINIGPQDQVSVDGAPLAPRERTRLFLFHKPRGLVTTDKDPEGRKTIFDHLQQSWPEGPRVVAIGRLDINTEGLLLLTNDGGLARVLELPSTGWMRRYRVRANGKTDQSILDRLRDGVTIDGIDYAGIEATLDRVQGDNVWLSIALREGKNREIKRVLEQISLYVNRLIRISFGPFQLGDLAEGSVEEIRTRVLRDQLGPVLAEEADADFDSPIAEPPKESRPPQRRTGVRGTREAGAREQRPRQAGSKETRSRETKSKEIRPRETRSREKPMRKTGLTRSSGADREPPRPVEPSFKPRGPRKHISAMRNTDGKPEQAGRKRTLLSETADRRGRTVVVERKAKVSSRKPREESAVERPEPVKPRGRAKAQNAFGAPGKPRNAAMAPAWQDSTQRPADGKRTKRKPSAQEAAARNEKPPFKKAPVRGAKPARPGAAKPAKPSRQLRPR